MLAVVYNIAAGNDERGASLVGIHSPLSTPEQKYIGLPEQKYIGDAGKKAPNWWPFRQTSGLDRIVRRGVRAGTA